MLETTILLEQHPLRRESLKRRQRYVDALAYNIGTKINEQHSLDIFDLYCKVLLPEEGHSVKPSPGISGLFKYRYTLYLDIWFITAFQDEVRGKELGHILEQQIPIIYRKKLWQLYEYLYGHGEKKTFKFADKQIQIWYENKSFAKRRIKKILFTANMSAGKSTLINALVGKRVNKSQNDTCTTKLHYIFNKPLEDGFVAEDDNIFKLDADYLALMTDDVSNRNNLIKVGTYFRSPFLSKHKLCFVDTPGVNSSLDESHRQITEDALAHEDDYMLVYVINGESIGTDDERKYMDYLASVVGNASIAFVVNKIDRFKKGEDSIADSLQKIRDDVHKAGFKNAMVLPVSANAGLLAKLQLAGDSLSEDDIDELDVLERKFRREEYNLLQFYPFDVQEKCKTIAETLYPNCAKKSVQLLLNCGILGIEQMLMLWLEG